jgi:foldase protein PrsA
MHNRNRIKLVAASLLVSLGLTGCGSKSSDTSGPVVAAYNGGQIHEGEFRKQFNLQYMLVKPDATEEEAEGEKKNFLENYILEQKLVLAQAKESGVKVDANQVNGPASQYKSQIIQYIYSGDANQFNQQMKKLGLTEKDLNPLIETFMYLEQFQQEKLKSVSVSEEEAKQYYNEHRDAYSSATVYHILTDKVADALIAKERVAKGEDFSKVAQEMSIDPSAKQNGGKMEGPLTQYVAPFRDAAATLEIGKLSEPVQTQYGYHIIKVEKRGEPEAFDKVKESIRQQLQAEKSEKTWRGYLEEMRKKANIQITLPTQK